MAHENDQSAEELARFVKISNLPFNTSRNRVHNLFERYGAILIIYMKHRASKNSNVRLANPRVSIGFEHADSVDRIMAARPIFIDDHELFVCRCLPITRRYPAEPFNTVSKLIVRTKAENPADILPADKTITEYLSLSGGKIDYCQRLNDTTVLVQFDDYDSVDVCCLARPHFINGQEIEIEKCLNENIARGDANVQQKSDDDYSPADMTAAAALPTQSIDDQKEQLQTMHQDVLTGLEQEHERLVASLADEWEQTARERIRLQRQTEDFKQEFARLEEDNKKYQKMFSESLKEKPRTQEDGEMKLSSAYQQVKDAERKREQLMQNIRP